MTEETSEVRARGPGSQQQGEVTLQSLMDFMSKKFEVINDNLEEVRREQNEKFEKQKEETNKSFKVISENLEEVKREQNEKFDKQNEKFDKLEELSLIHI